MTGGNLENNSDGVEQGVNVDAASQGNAYSKLIRLYVGKKLNTQKDRLAFAKQVKNSNALPNEIISEIESFKSAQSEFTGLQINSDTIKITDIQRELGSFLAELESKKSTLRSLFLQEFDITAQDYTKNIQGKIDSINKEQDLNALLDSDEARENFMQSIFKKKSPKRRLVSHVLDDLNIESRYDALEPHLKQGFIDTVSKFKRREKLQVEDIMVIFESKILTKSEKQSLIEVFMPSITLEEGIKLGLLEPQQSEKIKIQAIENALGTSMFSGVSYDSYISGIKNSELTLSTQGIFESSQSQRKLFEKNFFFEKFQSDFNAMLQKIDEDIASQSIQTVGEMQEILNGISHIQGIENFQKGSTIIIKTLQKSPSGETEIVTLYADIISLASAGRFIIRERGVNIYDVNNTSDSRQTYSQFIDFATKGDIPESIEIISSDTLKHRIQTGDIIDINGTKTFKNRSEINEDIESITKKIQERERLLIKEGLSKEERHKDEELLRLYRERNEKNIYRENLESQNELTLTEKIDTLDSAGKKFGFKPGVSFVTRSGAGDVFTLQSLDTVNQSVTIRGLQGDETIPYSVFIDSYETQNAQRVSYIQNFGELFQQTDDKYQAWQGFEFSGGKVNNINTKAKIDYNYLVPARGNKNQELIKIHSINDSMVTISFGEAKSNTKKDEKGKKKSEGEIFSVEKQEYTVSVGVLDHYIRQNGLYFRSLEEGKIGEEEKKGIPKPEEKFGLANWFFQGMSIASVVKGSKTAIEQITNMLNEGDDDKANQFALKMFGPILGEDGKTDLMSRVEQTQKKSMEEFIQRLKDINSHPATVLIESWLKDPRTPQYKVEAGLFYMFEKYGALCAKTLYKYQGQYFWYQRLGGTIGDKVWVETHAKNNREPKQNTTEEQLVYNLVSEQVKDGGYGGVKRRSKLAKELKAKRGQGKEEEYETGQRDGGNERDLKDRLDGGLGELSSGNYPNAFGWLDSVIGKGGTMKEMNMIPFIAVFSGMAYNFEKDILDKIKNFPGESKMIMMLRMMSYAGDIDLLNNTIMEVCKKLQNDPKYAGILPKAEKIFANQNNKSISEKDKQAETIKFYNEYGDVLTNVLYMLNTGDEDDVHNKMIFFEKDTNATFSQYYDKIVGYVRADGDFGKDEGLMADAFAGAGTSGIDIYRATKQMLELRTGGSWAKHESGPIMWNELVDEFEAIPKRKYSDDPVENEKMQRKLLDHNIRYFLAAITSLNTDTRFLSSYNAPTGPFNRLNDWGIYFDKVIDAGANADALKHGEHKELIDKFINGVMDYSQRGLSSKIPTRSLGEGKYEYVKDNQSSNDTLSVANAIQGKTQEIITPTPTLENVSENQEDNDDGY